jgi:hypothetical protein
MALSAASVVNRLRLVETIFHIFDLDNDGRITKEEIGKMLHTLVDVTNSNRKRREQRHHHHHFNDQQIDINLQKRIDDAFNELNTNDDDHITKDEFIEWYMKSGLLSDVQSNEINVPDTSRIQQFDKKSRKIRKLQLKLSTSNNNEASPPRQQLIRHMSHMTEQKAPIIIEDNDEEVIENNSSARIRANSDDTDSHYSKENERWQHLFNSVLGQIRAQRFQEKEQQQATTTATNGHEKRNNFHSWKSEGEEKLKVEYFKQKSNDEQRNSYVSPSKTMSKDYTTSPDVVTVRL